MTMYEQNAVQGRILIFVLTYQAEKHITGVFEKIPQSFFNCQEVHFLVIDDASDDASAEIVSQWLDEHEVVNATVLRNPVNQGYGGNQKLGYRLAVDAGFDFVVMLHGDGQYAPECLPEFCRFWREERADVVLGSRMHSLKSARGGGMPLYKIVGNRVLTWIQNWLTGQQLSEYHTGYRGYSTAFLRAIPFEINTNDFHFDTEILLQAHHVGAKVVEFPIATRYGDEICHVNGLKYALDVVLQTVRYRMHCIGMLCDLKYSRLRHQRYQNKSQQLYSSHYRAIQAVEGCRPASVLDVGCGAGFVAQRCEELGAVVTGLDIEEPVPGAMSHFYRVDLERDPCPVDAFNYDMILMLDVIEHLHSPETFLLDLRNKSSAWHTREKSPVVIISTPNVAFAAIRLSLLLGRFNYGERGILDIGHRRLFTRASLLRMLRDCGYQVEKVIPIGVPFGTVIGGWFGRLLGTIFQGLAVVMPRLFAFQFMVRCRPLPSIRQLLRQSQTHAGGLGLSGLPNPDADAHRG
jgi:2-polyprenyl-3-methyl-5-hydroxy-6-metoxy-1,4-benzoquinol methylase